jgi:hypothetical protein
MNSRFRLEVGKEQHTRKRFFQSPLPRSEYVRRRKPDKWREGRTFSVDPQEGSSRLPFNEYTALKEPDRRSLVLSLLRNVVICGGIRGREPRS